MIKSILGLLQMHKTYRFEEFLPKLVIKWDN
jgi:hypothetical protein